MKLFPISDTLLELMRDGYRLQIPENDADIILFLGDIASGLEGLHWAIDQCDRLGIPGLFIPGNHEYYGKNFCSLDRYMREAAHNSSVRFMNCDEHMVGDVRFLGATLWTDVSCYGIQSKNLILIKKALNDYRMIDFARQASISNGGVSRKLHPQDTLQTHLEHKTWLLDKVGKSFNGKTVLLTHHGISRYCHHSKYPLDEISAAFWSDLEELFDNKIDLALFGHTHVNVDGVCDAGFRIVSNQMEYRRSLYDPAECRDFSFNLLIDTAEL
ncbi:MAG: hypothetical protein GY845_37455 [Planctomycetes bacterium]|nr:hypothetical protein [Planctomycetota bacterium]